MELPFNIIETLHFLEDNPATLVFFAAFHPFALLLISLIPMWIFRKIGLFKPKEHLSNFGFSLIFIICVGWLIGFVSQMILLFMAIPTIKMLFIYFSMYLCIAAFTIVNLKPLRKIMEEDLMKKKVKA